MALIRDVSSSPAKRARQRCECAQSPILTDERLSTAEAVNNSNASRQWFSAKEAAKYTGLGFSTLAKLRLKGGGSPFSKIGEKILYKRSDLDAWLESKRVNNTSQYEA
jgi:excisionase family DNA binding protein